MKTRGTNEQVCQRFAEQEPEGGMSNGLGTLRCVVYPDGTVWLYTYGVKLAIRELVDGKPVIWINPRKYSVTTTRHASHLWSAMYFKERVPFSWPRNHWVREPELDKEMRTDSAHTIGRYRDEVMTWGAWTWSEEVPNDN